MNDANTRPEQVLVIHAIAAGLSLGLAYWLSTTALVQTAVQFITPAAVVFTAHLVWLWSRSALRPGFANRVVLRSLATTLGMAGLMFLGSMVLPTPANANVGDTISGILGVLFCVAILLLAGGAVYLAFLLLFKLVRGAATVVRGDKDDPETRYFDFGAVGVALVAMVATGLEGVPGAYRFPSADAASHSVDISAPTHAVWAAMDTATTPEVPLPAVLSSFPKPVEVSVDEGTALGARREVVFSGREGTGRLTLTVTERSPTRAVFTVGSDTSPFANWIAYRSLAYEVEDLGHATRLTLRLEYDRELSPVWFFGPLMRGAGYVAMGVLAGDVKDRAEG